MTVQTPVKTGSGMGVASLVLGIVAVIFALIPFVGIVAFFIGGVGLILGAIALFQWLGPFKQSSSYAIAN